MTPPSAIQHVTAQLADGGAVMREAGQPSRLHLVGSWRWVNDNCAAWFTAHGDSWSDAHLIRFDEARLVGDYGVSFVQAGNVVGYLTSIAHAAVDDPDDYHIGWKIWREVAPLHRAFVENAFARLLDDRGLKEEETSGRGHQRNAARARSAGSGTRTHEVLAG
jgi:hypothetical protein